jgi:hypothetical protein
MKFNIDIRPYQYAKPDIIKMYKKSGTAEFAQFCAVAFFPVIAVVEMCLEEYPDDTNLLRYKEKLIEFYDYGNIIK